MPSQLLLHRGNRSCHALSACHAHAGSWLLLLVLWLQGGCPMEQPCANFREGFMCGKCSEGYAQVSGKCVPCSGTNYAFFAFVIVASLGFTVFNVWLDRKDPNPLLSQVTFFVQVAVLIIPLSEMRCVWGNLGTAVTSMTPLTHRTQANGWQCVCPN